MQHVGRPVLHHVLPDGGLAGQHALHDETARFRTPSAPANYSLDLVVEAPAR